jgi:hypothetical protein
MILKVGPDGVLIPKELLGGYEEFVVIRQGTGLLLIPTELFDPREFPDDGLSERKGPDAEDARSEPDRPGA